MTSSKASVGTKDRVETANSEKLSCCCCCCCLLRAAEKLEEDRRVGFEEEEEIGFLKKALISNCLLC